VDPAIVWLAHCFPGIFAGSHIIIGDIILVIYFLVDINLVIVILVTIIFIEFVFLTI
jgi:hypothetical protein